MKEHKKTVLETGVKNDPAFCLGPSIEKTNSESLHPETKIPLIGQRGHNTFHKVTSFNSTPKDLTIILTKSICNQMINFGAVEYVKCSVQTPIKK